jgi:hypothetical protein
VDASGSSARPCQAISQSFLRTHGASTRALIGHPQQPSNDCVNSISAASVHNLVALFLNKKCAAGNSAAPGPSFAERPHPAREPLHLQRAIRLLLSRHPAASLG